MADKINYSPIGYFHSDQIKPYEAGRQPDERHAPGYIQLIPGQNFEQALQGLESFSHIWILFQFHHNENWKPMVSPPRGSAGRKVGVFATRAPYRPNNIGMSVVRLEKIDGLKIYVTEADLLDASPILDVKPYLPYVDAKVDANSGWIADEEKYAVNFSKLAREQLQWLESHLPALEAFLFHQLEFEPTNHKKKRVKKAPESDNPTLYTLAYKTWRIDFEVKNTSTESHEPLSLELEILRIHSGYSEEDLHKKEDPYSDKDLHLEFSLHFKI